MRVVEQTGHWPRTQETACLLKSVNLAKFFHLFSCLAFCLFKGITLLSRKALLAHICMARRRGTLVVVKVSGATTVSFLLCVCFSAEAQELLCGRGCASPAGSRAPLREAQHPGHGSHTGARMLANV